MHSAAAETGTAASAAREHYDKVSPLYRLLWGEHLHHGMFRRGSESPRVAQEELLKYCAARAHVPPGARVLDVGCGYGGTVIYLAERYGCQCTALTISGVQGGHAARHARAAGVERLINFVVGDAEAFNFGDDVYDLVWVMEASEHFADRAAFFRRVAAALHRGGRLLLSCWAAPRQTAELRNLAALCACPEFQSRGAYVDQVTAAGLNVSHAEELTASVAHTWDVVQRRARLLMPTRWAWPRSVRQFAAAIHELRLCFHSGELEYWVMVAGR